MRPVPAPNAKSPRPHAARAARSLARVGAVILLALALVGRAPEARAQNGPDVARQLEITENILDRSRTSSHCGPGDTRLPCTYLEQAVALQSSARASYASGFFRDALALTLRARERGYSVIRLGGDPTGGEFIRFSLERTDALIDRVAPAIRESGVDAAMHVLDVAVELQRRARQQADAGRPRAALSATTQARERAWRALRLADGAQIGSLDRARTLIERSDELLRDSAWLGGAGDRAASLYGRALDTERRAHDALDAREARRAVEITLRSREELARALQAAERGPDRASVERALGQSAQALATLRSTIGAGDPRLADLERAEDHHRRAQSHLEAGRFAQAMAELRAAEEIRRSMDRR